MADSDNLLDVFVNVGARGVTDTEKLIQDSVKRIKDMFAGINASIQVSTAQASAAASAAASKAGGSGGGAGGAGQKAGSAFAKEFKEAVLRFGLEKDLLNVRIALVGDEDAKRRIKDLQSLVAAEAKSFALADATVPLGPGGDAQRIAATTRVVDIRNQELKVLRDQVEALITLQNLDASRLTKATDIRSTKRLGEDVSRETSLVGQDISKLNDIGLQEDFRLAKLELDGILISLKRAGESGDILGVDESIKKLTAFQSRLPDFQKRATDSARQKDETDFIISEEKKARALAAIQNQLTQSTTRGLTSGTFKKDIAEATAEIKKAELEFDNAAKALDGTTASVDRLRLAFKLLNDPNTGTTGSPVGNRDNLVQLSEAAKASTLSTNVLQNNAYQLGQAFEDAAVGYSLNGFSGAVRGASNNITFLINQLSIANAQQAKLLGNPQSPIWTKLPLYAAIGAAIALLVTGPITDWLKSLDDIDGKLKDIKDELDETFEDRQVNIDFNIENSELERSLGTLGSVREILEKINDLQFEAGSKQSRIKQLFQGLDEIQIPGDDTDFQKIAGEIDKVAAVVLQRQEVLDKKLQNRRDRDSGLFFPLLAPRSIRGVPQDDFFEGGEEGLLKALGFDSLQDDVSVLKAIQAELFQVGRAVRTTFDEGKKGEATIEQLVIAQRTLAEFKKNIPQTLSQLEFTNQEAAVTALTGVVDTYLSALKEAEQLQREVANTLNEQFSVAFDAANRKVIELQDSLKVRRAVGLGINDEFDIELLELNAKIAEGRSVLREAADTIRSKSKGDPQGEQLAAALEQQFAVESLIELEDVQRKQRKDLVAIEERILDLKERQNQASKFTDFDAFSKQLQINAISESSGDNRRRKDLEEEQLRLDAKQENLKRLGGAIDRRLEDRDFNDVAGARRAADFALPVIDFANVPAFNLMNAILSQQLKEAQDQTRIQENTRKAVEKQDKVPRAQ